MSLLVALFGALIAAFAATGVASPATLLRAVSSLWSDGRGMWIAVVMRLVLGALLIVAAPDCRFPETVRVLGIIAIAAAVVLPLIGTERMNTLVAWWTARPSSFIRAWSLLGVAFGAFLVYAAL